MMWNNVDVEHVPEARENVWYMIALMIPIFQACLEPYPLIVSFHIDSKLGHMNCFGQWDSNKQCKQNKHMCIFVSCLESLWSPWEHV